MGHYGLISRDERPEEQSVDDALLRYFERACDLLCPHVELVDALGLQLEEHGKVSARRVKEMCREHGERMGDAR